MARDMRGGWEGQGVVYLCCFVQRFSNHSWPCLSGFAYRKAPMWVTSRRSILAWMIDIWGSSCFSDIIMRVIIP